MIGRSSTRKGRCNNWYLKGYSCFHFLSHNDTKKILPVFIFYSFFYINFSLFLYCLPSLWKIETLFFVFVSPLWGKILEFFFSPLAEAILNTTKKKWVMVKPYMTKTRNKANNSHAIAERRRMVLMWQFCEETRAPSASHWDKIFFLRLNLSK